MQFSYHELKEIQSAITKGEWLNKEEEGNILRKIEQAIWLSKPLKDTVDIEAAYVYASKMQSAYVMRQVEVQDNPLQLREARKQYRKWYDRVEELERKLDALELEEVLKNAFTKVPIIRVDYDSTRLKGSIEAIYEKIQSSNEAILVGTQMLSKIIKFIEQRLSFL